ncbi:NADH dehydrogenase [ubiquinone] 1 beta subcomplex subunit 9 [Linum perenne]
MSVATTAAYAARRAAQKQQVRILYRRALKDTLNWAVHRHLFYEDADILRAKFEVNKGVEDPDTIDRLIADGEGQYNKWRHPDPYMFHGLLVVLSSLEIQLHLKGLRSSTITAKKSIYKADYLLSSGTNKDLAMAACLFSALFNLKSNGEETPFSEPVLYLIFFSTD